MKSEPQIARVLTKFQNRVIFYREINVCEVACIDFKK
jgi:hypothetical protein